MIRMNDHEKQPAVADPCSLLFGDHYPDRSGQSLQLAQGAGPLASA
jgi:hypothetical protein